MLRGGKRPSRALIAVAAVVLLAALAAVASRSPLGGSAPSFSLEGGGRGSAPAIPTPWVISVTVVGVGIAVFLVIYSLRSGARRSRPRRRGGTFGFGSALQLALLLGVTAIAVLLFAHRRHPLGVAGPNRAGAGAHHLHRGPATPDFLHWLPIVGLTALIVLDLAILAIAFAPTRRRGTSLPAPEAARSAVEASLEALESEPDPRRAVIAAYRRMELVLSDAGLQRRAAESPREYLRRVLGALELSATPLTTLTGLFERARFSARQIGEPQRDEAVGALLALREELEEMRDAPGELELEGDATRS